MTTISDVRAAVVDGLTCPRRHVILERGPHYLQLAFGSDGRVLAEVVSNTFLAEEARLLNAHTATLTELGWRPPEAGDCGLDFCSMAHPNFWRFFEAPADPAVVAMVLAATASAVFSATLAAFTFDVINGPAASAGSVGDTWS